MTQVTFMGRPVKIRGRLPKNGQRAPGFVLAASDLSEVMLADFVGRRKVLNIFPCIDISTCAASVRMFNAAACHLRNTVVLCISADPPFMQRRFCEAENLNDVIALSTFHNSGCLDDYGVTIAEGALKGMAAPAVIVLDEHDRVLYSELISEVADEPNYGAALATLM